MQFMSTQKKSNSSYSSLIELKALQDQLEALPSSTYKNLTSKKVPIKTIPFIIMSKNGPLRFVGLEYNEKTNKYKHFLTYFFRIEDLDPEKNQATLSLLQPVILGEKPFESICDVERLKRTKNCVRVDLSCICAVQFVCIDILKEVIVEPAW